MFQTLTLVSAAAATTTAAVSAASCSFPRGGGRVKIPRFQSRVRAVATESPPTSRLSKIGKSDSESLYDVLKLNYNATATEIKTAYRSLAKIYHPDGGREQSDDGSDFIKIHNAYATLSDPVERQIYDLSIGLGIAESYTRHRMMTSSSFGFYSTRSWETDQCW